MRAYGMGLMFHREQVRDRNLLNWVLKLDYLDYSLSSGWEAAIPSATSVTRGEEANARRPIRWRRA
jgi:hypothetical protein